MSHDPIIDEVRAIRDQIAKEHGYDLDAIFRMLRDSEAASKAVHVTFPPRLALDLDNTRLRQTSPTT